jgi:VanZ family protein
MIGAGKQRAIRRWLVALTWMAMIFAVSSRSNPPAPDDPTLDFIWKKSVHIASYALLAVLVRRALDPFQQATPWALVLTLGYAISDEFHQSFVPGRTGRATDVLIDMFGAVLGLWTWRTWSRSIARTTRNSPGRLDQTSGEPSA